MRSKSSVVWNYFDVVNEDAAKCNVCHQIYSRKGKSTSALKSHLKSKHPEEYEEMNAEDVARKSLCSKVEAESPLTPLQTIRKQSTERENITNSSHLKSKEIDRLITELIALHNLPFSLVDWPGFRRLMHATLPDYKLRDRQFFIQHLCDVLYPQIFNKIKLLVQKPSKLSFTTDIWSEPRANVSFLGMTAHGIDSEFNRVSVVLKCTPYEDLRHNGQNITEKFKTMLAEWNISREEKLHCIVHNIGANMARAMNLAEIKDVACPVHKIQLCVRAAFEQEHLKILLTKCKKIVAHFNNSLTAQAELKKIQLETLQQQALSVVQTCSTRWNADYYMLQRFIEIKDSINLYTSHNKNIPMHSAQDWVDMEKYFIILKPFEEITKDMIGSQACISSVIPFIHTLKVTLTDQQSSANEDVKVFIEKLNDDLSSRFSDIENDMLYVLATYLDPRYKLKFFSDIIKDKVQSEVLCLLVRNSGAEIVSLEKNSLSDEDVGESSCKKCKIDQTKWKFTIQERLKSILESDDDDIEDEKENTMTSNQSTLFKSLLTQYNSEKRIKMQDNPLTWWKFNAIKYGPLIPIVLQYLSPPSGSTLSEQLFSGAGLIYDPLRNRLESEKAAKLLFIKCNLPLLNFSY